MANRSSICPQNIEDFKKYLLSKGYAIHDPVGFYEILRATHEKRKHPLIVYKRLSSNGGCELVHYSVLDRDMPVVKDFFRNKRKMTGAKGGLARC